MESAGGGAMLSMSALPLRVNVTGALSARRMSFGRTLELTSDSALPVFIVP